MKSFHQPVIGISCGYLVEYSSSALRRAYIEAVTHAGGIPILLPSVCGEDFISPWMELIDGLVLSGGSDIAPILFDQLPSPHIGDVIYERDVLEISLAREARRTGTPVFGICRGAQVMNVATGGTLIQDIPTMVDAYMQHRQGGFTPAKAPSHPIAIARDSLLARIVGPYAGDLSHFLVNSLHHQSVLKVGDGLAQCAVAPDGVIEAIESTDPEWFALGVQWHPEILFSNYSEHSALFRALVEASATNETTKAVYA